MSSYLHQFAVAFRCELQTIVRDKGVLLILVGAPFIYALLYSSIYAPEVVREVPVAVVDLDHTPQSRELTRKLDAGPKMAVRFVCSSLYEAKKVLYEGKINGIICLPRGFGRQLNDGGEAVALLYLDGSALLFYRAVLEQSTAVLEQVGADVSLLRLESRGVGSELAEATIHPVEFDSHILFNPRLGYGIFILPPVLLLILQQTLLIGVGMLMATQREERGEKSHDSITTLWGGNAALLWLYLLISIPLLTIHFHLFGLPQRGTLLTISSLIVPYLLGVIGLARIVGSLFHRREDSLLLLLWFSLPCLMLSGISLPQAVLPSWLVHIGTFIPSTAAMNGFVRAQTMGASLRQLMPEIIQLWVLALIYGSAATWMAGHTKRVCPKNLLDTPARYQKR